MSYYLELFYYSICQSWLFENRGLCSGKYRRQLNLTLMLRTVGNCQNFLVFVFVYVFGVPLCNRESARISETLRLKVKVPLIGNGYHFYSLWYDLAKDRTHNLYQVVRVDTGDSLETVLEPTLNTPHLPPLLTNCFVEMPVSSPTLVPTISF